VRPGHGSKTPALNDICLHPGEPLFLQTMASFDASGIATSFVHSLNFKDLVPR
jgi:hypothetical protein